MKKFIFPFVFVFIVFNTHLNLNASFEFPPLPGPFSVGTVSYHLKDEKRSEKLTYLGTDPRELMIQIWYPSLGKQYKPITPYMPKALPHIKKMIKKETGIPLWLLDYLLSNIYTYAQEGVALAPSNHTFPIILFSHGNQSIVNFYTAQLEALASYGYVVVGINHTYDCYITAFPNGKIILANEDYEPNLYQYLMQRIDVWVQDVEYVIDFLCKINKNDPQKLFTQKLDLDHIGMFGHSMGGATTTQVCRHNPRVKAGVNLDGPLFGKNPIEPFSKPFMFLLADQSLTFAATSFLNYERADWGLTKEEEAEFKKRYLSFIPALCCSINKDVYSIVVKNTGHNSFSDLPLLKQLSFLFKFFNANTGSIDPKLIIELTNAYLVAFFDKYLKNKPAQLLEVYCQRYAEHVVLLKWKEEPSEKQ